MKPMMAIVKVAMIAIAAPTHIINTVNASSTKELHHLTVVPDEGG